MKVKKGNYCHATENKSIHVSEGKIISKLVLPAIEKPCFAMLLWTMVCMSISRASILGFTFIILEEKIQELFLFEELPIIELKYFIAGILQKN